MDAKPSKRHKGQSRGETRDETRAFGKSTDDQEKGTNVNSGAEAMTFLSLDGGLN